MRRPLIYVIGPPGSGKTSFMRELTQGFIRVPRLDRGMPRDDLFRPTTGTLAGVELGRQRGSFSGTDALAMNIQPVACAWVRLTTVPIVFGEGQRLANKGFIDAALRGNRHVDLIYLNPPEAIAQARREARGSRQQESWIKGATTRAARLADEVEELAHCHVHRITDPDTADNVTAKFRKLLRLDQEVSA